MLCYGCYINMFNTIIFCGLLVFLMLCNFLISNSTWNYLPQILMSAWWRMIRVQTELTPHV